MSAEAGRTGTADSTDPLDANSVAELDGTRFNAWTKLDDPADTFVASNLAGLSRQRKSLPAVGHDAEVRMTDA